MAGNIGVLFFFIIVGAFGLPLAIAGRSTSQFILNQDRVVNGKMCIEVQIMGAVDFVAPPESRATRKLRDADQTGQKSASRKFHHIR
jgi:hypothetical protein